MQLFASSWKGACLSLTNRTNIVKMKTWEVKVDTKERGEEKNCRVITETDMRYYLSLNCKNLETVQCQLQLTT